jgi:formate/nitrite transporter
VAKAGAPALTTFVLALTAGAFIGLGAVLSTTVATGSSVGYGPTRWLAGVAFSLGLILVVVAGAELFTGNNLIVMSVVAGHVPVARLFRNWAIVYVGNALGALSVVVMVTVAEWWRLADSAVGVSALSTAAAKTDLSFMAVFARGVLANALVCLAIWLATGGRTVFDKIAAIIFPISAFVASGFEHSIANVFFIPMGLVLRGNEEVVAAARLPARQLARLDPEGMLTNLSASTLGNVIGGSVLVGLVYWFVYLAEPRIALTAPERSSSPTSDLLLGLQAEPIELLSSAVSATAREKRRPATIVIVDPTTMAAPIPTIGPVGGSQMSPASR